MTEKSNNGLNTITGTRLPIIQSPMAGSQDSRLAIAVCEAGGLGSVPCGMLNVEQIEIEIRAVRLATDKPFNLNFSVIKCRSSILRSS